MPIKTFQSEISTEDLDRQIQKFLSDGNYTEIERESHGFKQSGWVDYIARLTYEETLFKQIGDLVKDYIKYTN